MPDYSLGKVYKIVGNGKVYVGSTTRPLLCQRMTEHRCMYKRWKKGTSNKVTSFECLEDPECYIELLEACPCNSKDELHKCERKWIEALDCVNRCVVGRTQKEAYEQNKAQVLEKCQKYRDENRDKINQYHREHYQKIKEHKNQYKRERYHQRKLLASNNNLPIDPTNLLIEVESQKANLIVEHE